MAKLSAREFQLFNEWVRVNRPFFGAFQVPTNREGVRDTSLYKRWVKEQPIARVTERARRLVEPLGGISPFAVVGPESPGEKVRRATTAQREADAVGIGGEAPSGGVGGVSPFPTESPPEGFRWSFDRDLNRWVPQFTGLSAQQRSQQELSQRELELRERQAQPQPISPFQQEQLGLQRQRFEFEREQAEPRDITPFQQQQFSQQQSQFQAQLEFQQQQAQQQAELQRQQEMARLAANPINWLQYSAFTGEQPVVQPWMIPLGFQQFGQGGTATPQSFTQGGQQLQVGQPIPGVQGTNFSNLPQLRTPSAQLQARWGPTAQSQFLGFERARTGASPQESQFRLGSGRAPAGRFPGFGGFSRT